MAKTKGSAYFLARFIKRHLQLPSRRKQHNRVLRFLKSFLRSFFSLKGQRGLRLQDVSSVVSVKIQLKGKINNVERRRKRVIKVGSGVARMSLKPFIDYSSQTAVSQKGTIGVKVWVQHSTPSREVQVYQKLRQKKVKRYPRKSFFKNVRSSYKNYKRVLKLHRQIRRRYHKSRLVFNSTLLKSSKLLKKKDSKISFDIF